MATYHVSLGELPGRIAKDMKAREKRIRHAVQRTAELGVHVVQQNVPVAFKELQNSVHAESLGTSGARVVADAPHAAAVEVGSRPHWPPLEPILAWVRLRGMQGLKSPKQIARLAGTTTARHAQSVAQQIRAMQRPNGSTPADAALQIAQAIRAAIGKNGTRPHFYMQQSLPAIEEILHQQIAEALPDKD